MVGPVKKDAQIFLSALKEEMHAWEREEPCSTSEVIKNMEIKHNITRKRCIFLLKKWSRKGWYAYATHIENGYLTAQGMVICSHDETYG